MRNKFLLFLATIAITLFATHTPTTATTDGLVSLPLPAMVDGHIFHPYGYICARRSTAVRLVDMAYMLNGTPAQFALRQPPNNRWDYWIILGEPHAPTGTEFRPIPDFRFAWAGDGMGYGGWEGFDNYPISPVVIGIGGEHEPAYTVALIAIRDVDYAHFATADLARLLGFHLQYEQHYHFDDPGLPEGIYMYITTQNPVRATFPQQMPELARLLARLNYRDHGHWVSTDYLYAEDIAESVVWPAQFRISPDGFNPPSKSNRWHTVAPFIHGWHWDEENWEREQMLWYPMEMRELPDGKIELTVTQPEQPTLAWGARPNFTHQFEPRPARFDNYRIVVDPTSLRYIWLYIGNTRHTMFSFRPAMHFPGRSQAVPATTGITIRYVESNWAWNNTADAEIGVYRSPLQSSRGLRLHTQDGMTETDPLLWQFTDYTAEWGQVYYYSIWAHGEDRSWQIFSIRVDTAEVMEEPEYVPVYEPYTPQEEPVAEEPTTAAEPYTVEESTIEEAPAEIDTPPTNRSRMIIPPIIILLALVFTAIKMRRKGK